MILFYAVPLGALITGGALHVAGVSRRTAVWAGVAAGVVTAVVAFTVLLTFLFECASDGGSDPEAWPWSPRNQLCDGSGWDPVVLGMLALLLVPTVLIGLGTWLRSRGRRGLGWIAYAGLLVTPALSGLYVSALPVYEVDEYPILHSPLLRVARGSEPPRVCYAYGIVGERAGGTRDCIELEPTARARRLTNAYDEGETVFDLEEAGKNLTRKGLPVRPGETGVDGLVVTRAYELSAAAAREGASEPGVNRWPIFSVRYVLSQTKGRPRGRPFEVGVSPSVSSSTRSSAVRRRCSCSRCTRTPPRRRTACRGPSFAGPR